MYPAHGAQAITIVGGKHCAVRGVRALSSSPDAAIGINLGEGNEVANCDVGGALGGPVRSPGRCIWTLATTRNAVHDNHVHDCRSHALDFDAFTSASACYSNTCENNGEEGIFVEETAHGNVVVNNTCRNNSGSGIGVYANAVGPVANNFFLGNVLIDNGGAGISAGGYGHAATKHSDHNLFASNRARGNGRGAFAPSHGANEGDFWVDNLGEGPAPVWAGPVDGGSANVSVFEP